MTEPLDRVKYLEEELGVAFAYEYVYEDRGDGRQRYELPHIVSSVDLGLTPLQWCAIAMRDPAEGIPACYVGGCCGNMSYAQDIINGVFRDGGRIGGSELLTLGRLMREHDGSDSYFKPRTDEEFIELAVGYMQVVDGAVLDGFPDPWAKIGLIFLACEDRLDPNLGSELRPERYREDYPEDKKAFNLLDDSLRYMRYADLFEPREDDFEHVEDPERRKEYKQWNVLKGASHDAGRVLNFAKLLGPIRRVHDLMEARDDVFQGWAILDPETREPLRTGMGEAFFYTREDAEWLVGVWERDKQFGEERDIPENNRTQVPEHIIVPVTVTVEGGLTVLDEEA